MLNKYIVVMAIYFEIIINNNNNNKNHLFVPFGKIIAGHSSKEKWPGRHYSALNVWNFIKFFLFITHGR